MQKSLFAALAVAAMLGWGLSDAFGQQSSASPGGAGQAGAGAQASPAAGAPSGTAAGAGAATADPAKMQTYVQMRKYLTSQVISTTPADLSGSKDAIDKHLKAAASRQWMSTDEFIQFHKQVQSDPKLKAQAEAMLAGQGAGASATAGASPAGGASTTGAAAAGSSPGASGAAGASASPGAASGAATSGAQPSTSPK
jgi:hypothetical protein